MEKKTIYIGLLIVSAIGFFGTVILSWNAEDITIPLISIFITFLGMMIGLVKLDNIDRETPVSEKELDKLKSFGKEPDTDNYSDWFEFSIVPMKKHGVIYRWSFSLFDETDGKTYFVRYVDNMRQLKDVYKGITDKELE